MCVGAGEPLVPAEEVLRGCEHILLYFSAAWCERGELERLRQWYSAQRARASPQPRFEVVYVSGDRTEAEFRDYYAGMPWPAVPWGHECCPRLNVSCGVAGEGEDTGGEAGGINEEEVIEEEVDDDDVEVPYVRSKADTSPARPSALFHRTPQVPRLVVVHGAGGYEQARARYVGPRVPLQPL